MSYGWLEHMPRNERPPNQHGKESRWNCFICSKQSANDNNLQTDASDLLDLEFLGTVPRTNRNR